MGTPGDQAEKLRKLAERERAEHRETILTFSSLEKSHHAARVRRAVVLVAGSILIASAVAGVLVIAFIQNNKKYDRIVQSLHREQQVFKEEVGSLNARLESLNVELVTTVTRNQTLAQQLSQQVANNSRLRGRISDFEAQQDVVSNELGITRQKLRQAESAGQETKTALQEKIKELEGKMEELDGRLHSLAALDLNSRNDAAPGGKIVAIDRDNRFVVVNMGRSGNVEVHTRLAVMRGEERTAELEVTAALQEVSACEIRGGGNSLQIGDTVKIIQ